MKTLALVTLVLAILFLYCHAYKMGWFGHKEGMGGSTGFSVISGLAANNVQGLYESPEGTVYSSNIGPVLV